MKYPRKLQKRLVNEKSRIECESHAVLSFDKKKAQVMIKGLDDAVTTKARSALEHLITQHTGDPEHGISPDDPRRPDQELVPPKRMLEVDINSGGQSLGSLPETAENSPDPLSTILPNENLEWDSETDNENRRNAPGESKTSTGATDPSFESDLTNCINDPRASQDLIGNFKLRRRLREHSERPLSSGPSAPQKHGFPDGSSPQPPQSKRQNKKASEVATRQTASALSSSASSSSASMTTSGGAGSGSGGSAPSRDDADPLENYVPMDVNGGGAGNQQNSSSPVRRGKDTHAKGKKNRPAISVNDKQQHKKSHQQQNTRGSSYQQSGRALPPLQQQQHHNSGQQHEALHRSRSQEQEQQRHHRSASRTRHGFNSSQQRKAGDNSTGSSNNLRYIVIDGSNVAMAHGNRQVYSCRGIQICVEHFLQRGHQEITAFVPRSRTWSAGPDNNIKDQHLLGELEKQGHLVFTPAKRLPHRTVVAYDDKFVIKLAKETGGIIVSNDYYRDLWEKNPEWRPIIENRVLMFLFVGDLFMPPDDPLGRTGPHLDDFLRVTPLASNATDPRQQQQQQQRGAGGGDGGGGGGGGGGFQRDQDESIYVAVRNYVSCNSANVSLDVEDVVFVRRPWTDAGNVQPPVGWLRGRVRRTGKSGLFPAANVDFLGLCSSVAPPPNEQPAELPSTATSPTYDKLPERPKHHPSSNRVGAKAERQRELLKPRVGRTILIYGVPCPKTQASDSGTDPLAPVPKRSRLQLPKRRREPVNGASQVDR